MKSLNRTRVGLLLGAAACAALLMPLSCGDDTTAPAPEDAAPGTDAKVDSSNPDTGSKMDGTTTDTKSDTPQESASEAEAAAADTGGGADADAGTDASDAGDASADAPPDGDGGPQCDPPAADSGLARACLVFTGVDQVTPVTLPDGAATDLDNEGTLLIYAFAVPNPSNGGADGGPATPIAQPIAIPPPDDAGLFTVEMPVNGLIGLQPIPIDVPVTTAYIVSYFVDNKAGFNAIAQGTLTYGMYVGGIDLTQGIQPVPPLRSVSLTAGQGTIVNQYLTVMREFSTVVVRATVQLDGGLAQPAPGGDGTGPLAVGAYRQALPDPTRVYGGALATCVDIIHEPAYPVTGFFYTPTAGGNVWFGADLNDFGDTTNVPPLGSMISAVQNDAGMSVVPDQQMVMVGANDYAVTLPGIGLTGAVPPGSATDLVHCPFPPPDAGSDATGD